MEYDESRVYTALNAHLVEVGSKIIVANTIADLKQRVINDKLLGISTLEKVNSDDEPCRFRVDNILHDYALAYLVELPRKLKWTDLKVGDVIEFTKEEDNFNVVYAMVVCVDITDKNDMHIYAGGVGWLRDNELENWRKE